MTQPEDQSLLGLAQGGFIARYEHPSDGEFNGRLVISIPGQPEWRPGFFEFHHVMAATWWLEISIDEARKRHLDNQPKLLQEIHLAYMQSKYPGWPHGYTDPKLARVERAGPAEHVKTAAKLEDLDL